MVYAHNRDKVYNAMISLSDEGELAASYEEISSAAGVPRRTAARVIKELEADGSLTRIHAKGRGITNIYHIRQLGKDE